MKDINTIIEKWIKTSTVPSNSELSIGTVRAYTQNGKKILESFNNLTYCKFIEYNDERRIVITNCYDSRHFIFYKYDCNIEYERCFDNLIYDLIGSIYKEGNSGLDDTIKINIKDTQDVLKYFSINYIFNPDEKEEDYKIENGYYLYEGDNWDDDAEYYFHESDLYKNIRSFLIDYFKYDFAPYIKYNTDFNPFEVDTKELTLDEKFEKMSNNQFAKILVNYLNIDGIFVNRFDATDFCMTLIDKINDKKLFKNLLLSLVDKCFKTLEEKERILNREIEYILNI